MFEGRWGQSIRFGSTTDNSGEGTAHPNKWSNEGEKGNPITIIRNGQGNINKENSFERITEDINGDNSSIYLCANQQISNFLPASTYDASYQSATSVFNTKMAKQANVPNTDLDDNTEEDIELTTPNNIVPIELQGENELQFFEDSETAFYDIQNDQENQVILPGTIVTLPQPPYVYPTGTNLATELG